jgi:arginyl-tRNA synthetase
MVAGRDCGKKPREIAEAVVLKVESSASEMISALSIAGPGFINITLQDTFLAVSANRLLADPRLGVPEKPNPHTVIVDFGGPNVAKPMHVGHLRSTIIGDCLQRLIRFLGDKVISDIHLGDWGTQMGMLICELQRRQPDLPYFDEKPHGSYPAEPPITLAALEEMYPTASKRCKSDDAAMLEAVRATAQLQRGRPGYVALWEHFASLSVSELKRDFGSLGVAFDQWLGESSYGDRMSDLVTGLMERGVAVCSDGAVVLPVAEQGDTKDVPPLLLEKSEGGYLYGTSDLAAIQDRIERFHADEMLYVVDKRQSLHFTQLFRAARKAGLAGPNVPLQHVAFGTMNGTDGKPYKTREGGVMKLSDLVRSVELKASGRMEDAGVAQELSQAERDDVAHKVAIATLKFADLSNHRESDYTFDIEKFTRFEGKTGPYLLYTAVRIKSILRNAKAKGLMPGSVSQPSAQERQLILLLCSLPDVLTNARESFLPNYLCEFAYEVAQEFNRFYRECHILSEPDRDKQASWLALIQLVLNELELVLGILGIEIPEKM